jgi:sarcosine oxidase subunit alpha
MSHQPYRLASGGHIDRDHEIEFTFNGRSYRGHPGDTLASALLANGVHFVGRGFKYHRPRGIFAAGAEEPNALVQLGRGPRTEPNLRATQIALYDGLSAASQNVWPSLNFDLASVNQWVSKFMPAGFYYKTFMWPASQWMRYEHIIRMAAGLGKAPADRDPDRYEKIHDHCDVLIVGAGPAGLAAASAAVATGARVIVTEAKEAFGGQLRFDDDQHIDGMPAQAWVDETTAKLQSMAHVTLLPRTTVSGYYDHNYITALERVTDHIGNAPAHLPRQRFWKIRAKQVVLATGAIERPLVFADNDRPGILLAAAVREYVNSYGVLAGRESVVFTNNDDAYRTALALDDAHAKVTAIVDLRPEAEAMGGDLVAAAKARGMTIHFNHAIVGVSGHKRVTGCTIMALTADGSAVTGAGKALVADCIAMSGGWSPSVHLFSQSRGKLRWDEKQACFVPDIAHEASSSAGASSGDFSLTGALKDGLKTGIEAARAAGAKGRAPATPKTVSVTEMPLRAIWQMPTNAGKGKQFVDFQSDVTAADIRLAAQEGYLSVEHTKRYTTTGMGTDQGRTSNVNALAILASARDAHIPDVGTTTFRPPLEPVAIGAFAGRAVGGQFEPVRNTPMAPWHRANGARFEHVGQWMRAWYYPRGTETMRQAVDRECRAARTGVGILDASTLGKIDVKGPDAAEFLNRIYTNGWLKLAVGRARYGLMLGEDGMVMDDGVTVRLAKDHFHMTTTTGGAAGVLDWLEEWSQTEWPDLKVYFTSVTEQWAVASICGPKSRELLAALSDDIDLSEAALPFMGVTTGTVAGLPARVFRISFTGELSFEINVPSRHGLALWTALMAAGEKYDITPYGTEAMHVLRAEKGFIIVGQETDGSVTPGDLGMDWIVSAKKGDFVGKRSLARSDSQRADRKQLVGLLSRDPEVVLPEGAQVVADLKTAPPMAMLGHVTSSYYSANCGRSIAMAVIAGGRSRMGDTVYLPLADGRQLTAVVTEPQFFDPQGERLNG